MTEFLAWLDFGFWDWIIVLFIALAAHLWIYSFVSVVMNKFTK